MLCVLGQQLLLQSLDALGIALGVQIRPLLHSSEGSPALGIYDIGILKCVCHVVAYPEGAAGFLCVGLCHFLNLRHDLIAFRMSQDHFHAHAGHQSNHALGNGEGLAVGGGVGPGHGQLLAL